MYRKRKKQVARRAQKRSEYKQYHNSSFDPVLAGERALKGVKALTGPAVLGCMGLLAVCYFFFLSVNNQYTALLSGQKIPDVFKKYGFLPSPSGWNCWVLWDGFVQVCAQIANSVIWLLNVISPFGVPDIPTFGLPANAPYTLVSNLGWFFVATVITVIMLGVEALLARDYADNVMDTLEEKRALAEYYNSQKKMKVDPNAIHVASVHVEKVNYHELDGVLIAALGAFVGTAYEAISYILTVPKTTDDYILIPGMDGAHWIDFAQVLMGFEIAVIMTTICFAKAGYLHRIKKEVAARNRKPELN